MINWQYFPKSDKIPSHLKEVVEVFENEAEKIDSENYQFSSDEVLSYLRSGLESINYEVERSKKRVDKIQVPVLFGRNGKLDKYFEADGLNEEFKTVLEVEAGRAVANYQFLKDLFQASVMHDIEYLVIAVRNIYKSGKDFEKVISFLNTLYTSDRLKLPLSGILIIGY
ncbi:hypothetical protein [Maribacter sp. 2304DJ31-5]|uniref:hypothetical protein n=1 Tax=Maribacter sp. 2304DJ31-5 TaxID=3386273 RepID=UPI0039BCD2F9